MHIKNKKEGLLLTSLPKINLIVKLVFSLA